LEARSKLKEASVMRKWLVSVVATTALAIPASASAFHHVFLPGGACGESANSGGANPTATAALIAAGHKPPIAPAGTAAVEHSDRIGLGAECPAPAK
jgi:hypothetical protein